ncbi:MAG: C40 family peptidase [Bifidobacterium angulatum]|jgi:cell wall-associated NlpC family hydrolase|uniref:C40 family peptidase n=2 Tax=Bifidobacterium angulatum TaxID=1683 RepID=UPI002658E37A|nr:C40 family peptidase [Bifidobacterium angulatum]MEE0332612.1 C40 family peptidase [Bifidobacterium angulatum]
MKTVQQTVSMFVAAVAVCATFVAAAPAATAADQSGVVASERSFPKTSVARKDVLKESVSTDVKGNWGGIESLNVPKTKSQAEKDAEAKAEQERQEAAARAQQEAAAQQAAAASRSATRSSLESSSSASLTVNPPDSKTAAALVSYAEQFVGQVPYVWGGSTTSGWDCSGFVMYVFAQFGISLPHSSGAQAGYGTAVPSLASAQPGDIIANSAHAGIYVGNGMVVNALNPSQGTQITPVAWAFTGSYSIRRLL